MKSALAYLHGRLDERGTWTGIGAVLTAAAALPAGVSWHFSAAFILVGVIAVLAPTP